MDSRITKPDREPIQPPTTDIPVETAEDFGKIREEDIVRLTDRKSQTSRLLVITRHIPPTATTDRYFFGNSFDEQGRPLGGQRISPELLSQFEITLIPSKPKTQDITFLERYLGTEEAMLAQTTIAGINRRINAKLGQELKEAEERAKRARFLVNQIKR